MRKVLYPRWAVYRGSLVLLCTLLLAVSLPRALYADPTTTPGEWREWSQDRVTRTGTRIAREPGRADLQELFDRLTEIATVFRATPSLAAPAGFDVKGSRTIDLRAPHWAVSREAPARALLTIYLFPYVAQADGSVEADDLEFSGRIYVHVNQPAAAGDLIGGSMRTRDGEYWYVEPRPIGTIDRFTHYEQVGYDPGMHLGGKPRFVVLAPVDFPPLWLPVSVEEYATEIIGRWEGHLAQMRERLAQLRFPERSEQHRRAREALEQSFAQLIQLNPQLAEQLRAQRDEALRQLDASYGDLQAADREQAEYAQRVREAAEAQQAELEADINAMKAELAALSPAERRAQAVGKLHPHRPGADVEGEIVPVTVPGGSDPGGIVRVNRNLFDRSRPTNAPQLMIVSFRTRRDFVAERFSEIERQLDWDALARMIR